MARRGARTKWAGLALAAAALAGGCVHPGYLAQAARGQWDLLRRGRPIVAVLQDPSAPVQLRRVLARIHEIRAFARRSGLDASRSYEHFVHVEDDAVAWVVQASAPLAFEAREWWFPLVGSVPYLGFFDRADAAAYAERLAEEEKVDVYVRGATAYSTLGWFDDPVLSSMIPPAPDAMGAFANVILHESVHATVYVAGQSTFNESVASFVADRLTERWLAETFGAADPVTKVWVRQQARFRARAAQLREAYRALEAVYASDRQDEEKLREKARIAGGLKRRFGREVNNAVLLGFKTYDTGTAAFERLLAACGGDWTRFLGAVKSLEGARFPEPQAEEFDAVIDGLAAERCGEAASTSARNRRTIRLNGSGLDRYGT